MDNPLRHLREVESQTPNSRAWGGRVGPFLVELDFQQTPSGRGGWGAQCYDASGTQLSSVSGDTLEEVFKNLGTEVRGTLQKKIEQLYQDRDAFEDEILGGPHRPSLFERLSDEHFRHFDVESERASGPSVFGSHCQAPCATPPRQEDP